MIKRQLTLWLALALLAGCSVIQSQDGEPVPDTSQLAVVPLNNLSQTPQAGDQAASVLSTILRANGAEQVRLYLPDGENPLVYESRQRQREAIDEATRDGAEFILTGTVDEWRYKSGLDGEPAVGVTLEVRRVQDNQLVWSGTSARTGWGRESLSVAGHKVLQELVDAMPLISESR